MKSWIHQRFSIQWGPANFLVMQGSAVLHTFLWSTDSHFSVLHCILIMLWLNKWITNWKSRPPQESQESLNYVKNMNYANNLSTECLLWNLQPHLCTCQVWGWWIYFPWLSFFTFPQSYKLQTWYKLTSVCCMVELKQLVDWSYRQSTKKLIGILVFK